MAVSVRHRGSTLRGHTQPVLSVVAVESASITLDASSRTLRYATETQRISHFWTMSCACRSRLSAEKEEPPVWPRPPDGESLLVRR